MKMEVFSDIVCPWCYIGERRLAGALRLLRGEGGPGSGWDLEIVYRPYQLDPDAPVPGIPLVDYLERRYGAMAGPMRDRVSAVAGEEGISVDWDAAVAANTFDAHRLLAHALERYGPAAQATLVDRLFEAHFARGLDVADHDTLVSVAGEAGMDAAQARAYLDSDAGVAALQAQLDAARRVGIRAVPSFVLEGKYLVEGAQPAENLAEAIRRVAGEASPRG